jgi:hypothetical protein
MALVLMKLSDKRLQATPRKTKIDPDPAARPTSGRVSDEKSS